MTKVSRYPLRKEVEQRMYEIFVETIANLRDRSEIEAFLKEFISPVEKIMLAKRLAIAVLLEKGYDYQDIRRILRVTPSTIAVVSRELKYSQKGYKKVVAKVLKSEKMDNFWEKINDILTEALPVGSDSWSYQMGRHQAAKRDRQNKRAF